MKGLFLGGSEDGDLVIKRLSFTFRDQYALTPRTYAFGQFDYLRDTFKQIDYLIAPAGGIGYKVVDSPRTKRSVARASAPSGKRTPIATSMPASPSQPARSSNTASRRTRR